LLSTLAAKLRAALAEEAEQGRLAPWLAAGFCAGVLLYFVAPTEPSWIAAVLFFAGVASLGFYLRERVFAWALTALVAAIFALVLWSGPFAAQRSRIRF
jgi:nicotinamide riboside transporter PnuC